METYVFLLTRKVVNVSMNMTRKVVIRRLRGRNMPLNNKLKEYRAKLGVNQQEMGKLVHTSFKTNN